MTGKRALTGDWATSPCTRGYIDPKNVGGDDIATITAAADAVGIPYGRKTYVLTTGNLHFKTLGAGTGGGTTHTIPVSAGQLIDWVVIDLIYNDSSASVFVGC